MRGSVLVQSATECTVSPRLLEFPSVPFLPTGFVLVHCQITPDTIEIVAKASLEEGVRVADMLLPEYVVKLTEGTRK